MRRKIKYTIITLVLLILGSIVGYSIWKSDTKNYSPEETVTYRNDNLLVEVFYNRPYKKGRKIFGSLVPFQEVWRTGANEATTFETNRPIKVDGSFLKAGKYTLWTIPGKESWKVIFNDKMYAWGIELSTEEAARDPESDVLTLEAPVQETAKSLEQFSIYFTEEHQLNQMHLAWSNTLISIPFIEVKN